MSEVLGWLTNCPATDINFKSNLSRATAEEIRKALAIVEGRPNSKTKEKALRLELARKAAGLESTEQRAVKIAAKVMAAAGLCRTEHPELCQKSGVDRENCEKCIRGWLLSKARRELKQEEMELLEVKHDGN